MKKKHSKLIIGFIMMIVSVLARADDGLPPIITGEGVYFSYRLNHDTLLINNPNGTSTLCTGSGSLILCQ